MWQDFEADYVPRDENLRKSILDETNQSKFLIHTGMKKMDWDLKRTYW